MSAFADVVECGLVVPQDLGRWGWQQVGVPVAGALHPVRYRVAAMLLGHVDPQVAPPGPAVLEVLTGLLTLEFRETVRVVVVGEADVSIGTAQVAAGCVVEVGSGQSLGVVGHGTGPVYVGLDGWQAPEVLGSASYDSFSDLGPGPLAAGQALLGTAGHRAQTGWFHRAMPAKSARVRALAVDMAAWSRAWRVVDRARSGLRLAGEALPLSDEMRTRPSDPVVRGTIQIPPSGQPVILGPDGAITGGYRVAGVVISAHLGRLADAQVGDELVLETTTMEEAQVAWEQQEAWLRTCIVRTGTLH